MTATATAMAVLAGLGAVASAQEVVLATSRSINPQLLTVDPATGSILNSLAIQGEEALFGGLAFDGTSLWSVDGYNDGNSDRTFAIDPATGNGVVVGPTGQNWNFRSVEVHPLTGVLYASRDNELYTLSKTTGVATSVAPITGPSLDQLTSIAIRSDGALYGVDIGGTGLYSISLTTGAATLVGSLNLTNWIQDLAFDSTGLLWAITSSGDLYTVQVSTAVPTFNASVGPWAGMAFSGCPAPTAYCTPGTSASGCSLSIGSTGTPSANATSGFTLSVGNVDAQRSGLFFYGLSDPNFVPLAWDPAGSSFLCVKPPTQRMPLSNSGGSSGCTGSFTFDWNAFMDSNPAALGSPRTVGARFEAQLWMRDPAATKTTVLSNALRFELCP